MTNFWKKLSYWSSWNIYKKTNTVDVLFHLTTCCGDDIESIRKEYILKDFYIYI